MRRRFRAGVNCADADEVLEIRWPVAHGTAEAKEPWSLPAGKANCTACHVGPNFTDERLHNTGVAWRDGRFTDLGAGQGTFKTPTLREIARTAPYMHDGSIATLEQVIDYYNRGGNKTRSWIPKYVPSAFQQRRS